MSQRTAMIEEAKEKGANLSALCRKYAISRKTAYKWLKREREAGLAGLADQSRRPHTSPAQSIPEVEQQVLAVRQAHPQWGGRKIRRWLKDHHTPTVPAASTITRILRRNGQVDAQEAQKHQPFQRFEHALPNELWQMDFKGPFALLGGGSCHPLTVIDDHSRFIVGLKACPNQTFPTVQSQLTLIFQEYGLPERMLMDNGAPWGDDWETRHTILTAWLLRLDIAVSHGRPYHPQTQGKDERFNRTLKAEVISGHPLQDLAESQTLFDQWGHCYNYERPHEALQLDTPAAHYQPSPRPFPAHLPPILYNAGDLVYKVDLSGMIYLRGRAFRIGGAFRNQPVALRPNPEQDGWLDVFFCKHRVAQIYPNGHNQG